MTFGLNVLLEAWRLFEASAIYVIFGLTIGGLLKAFLSPAAVARHLGRGRILSVFKAALLGMPLPLCSCGVLPAAASLRRQGATKGATAAFVASTPETGLDSMAVTYALLDPIMTVARPVAAFIAAVAAGVAENLINRQELRPEAALDLSCPVDGCCDGINCPAEEHAHHHTTGERIAAGLKFAASDLWGDLAGWYFAGLVLAGLIAVLVPVEVMSRHLGGGLGAMLWMLAAGIPLYICATASTPVAAALILKGVSPGAALVFLLAGPATNIASLTVLSRLLGRREVIIYLAAVSVTAVICGLAVDQVYAASGLSAQAAIGRATEMVPHAIKLLGVLILSAFSLPPLWRRLTARFHSRRIGQAACGGVVEADPESACHCHPEPGQSHPE